MLDKKVWLTVLFLILPKGFKSGVGQTINPSTPNFTLHTMQSETYTRIKLGSN